MTERLIAGVELGGTKAVTLLARGQTILKQARVPTTSPGETLGRIRSQLLDWYEGEPFAALGIASFGPIRVDPGADDFGYMLATPKVGWSRADIAGTLTRELCCPWQIDTDVNAAALAEWHWGAATGLSGVCYITLGTGVGGGLLLDGASLHGALHPEIGHLKMRRAPGDYFAGVCPFHGDCVEGLISGPALLARFGCAGENVADDDPQWSFVAHDLAALIAAVSLTASPSRVLIGGGVGVGRPALLERVRLNVVVELSGYLPHVTSANISRFVVPAGLGDRAGPLGAVALGYRAANQIAPTKVL